MVISAAFCPPFAARCFSVELRGFRQSVSSGAPPLSRLRGLEMSNCAGGVGRRCSDAVTLKNLAAELTDDAPASDPLDLTLLCLLNSSSHLSLVRRHG